MVTSTASSNSKPVAVFARHETFHPRFGWIKKGYDLAVENPGIFLEEDAPVRLGVGKNMVRSIRYWCVAFKVLVEDSGQSKPTDFGNKLLGDGGWDPFLENPASLWLLHWNLLKQTCLASAWDHAFNQFNAAEFTQEVLFADLREYTDTFSSRIADSSLKKDINCILRMYAEQGSSKGPTEDSIDCPFTELRLLYSAGDGRRYEFQVGPKENLPADIVVVACLDYATVVGEESSAMGISRLAHLPGSPGRVFKLTEAAIADAIEQLTRKRDDLFITDSAGLLQLQYEGEPRELSEAILDEYFLS